MLPLEVTVASTDSLDPDLGFEFRIQRRYSSFFVTEYSTAHLIIQLVNTADRSRRIRLYSRGVFSIPYPNERPTWVLATPREADALWSSDGRTPGCWQFAAKDYGFQRDLNPNSVELAPGASIATAYELWVDPERESCWPTGSVRFESPADEYVVESDGEETEFSWGFTLDVTPR